VRTQPPPHLPGSYLVVELTNRCSLACVHCSVSETDHPHHLDTGYIDPALVHGLLEDLVRVGARFDTLILFWLGEPLLHPHFSEIWRAAVRAAVRHGTFGQIEVHTNGTHLDQRRVDSALNAADLRQVWHFSLDAISRDTYEAVKGLDRFAQVQENVARFVTQRAERGAPWPRPVFQFIVGSNNVDEVGAFRAHWEQICQTAGSPVRAAAGHVPPGDDAIVFFRQLDCPTPADQERENAVFRAAMSEQGLLVPSHAAAGVQVRAHNTSACSGFWKSPVIGWQGDVTTCTRDNHLENRVGNLNDDPFSALWWGDIMRDRRERVASGDYAGLKPCATCFIPRSMNYTGLDAEDVQRQAAWEAAS
jgi:radical SAM protein with 4Fe4S-binding SPASM domain